MGARVGAIAAIVAQGAAAVDPDLASWLSRVAGAGGSVSSGQQAAVGTFITGLKSDGLWTKLRRLNPFVGEQLAACLIPLVNTLGSTADTNNNFVSGDFSQTLGLLANGSSKYIATGAVPPVASGRGGLSIFLPGTPPTDTGSTHAYIGARDGSLGSYNLTSTTTPGYGSVYGGVQSINIASALPGGLLHLERRSTTDLELYQAGTSVGTNVNLTAVNAITYDVYVGARNNDGSPQIYTINNTRLGGYAITDGTMSDTNAANFSARWATMRSSL